MSSRVGLVAPMSSALQPSPAATQASSGPPGGAYLTASRTLIGPHRLKLVSVKHAHADTPPGECRTPPETPASYGSDRRSLSLRRGARPAGPCYAGARPT